MDGSGDLRLFVLGELRGSHGDVPVDLGGRRQRAVLAALVIARGEAVPADRLADCVWGDAAPANAPATLQSYVSHLRRRLEPEAAARTRDGVIAKVGPGYALRLGLGAVDAWRFEGAVGAASNLPPAEAVPVLDDALGLWQGPAYVEYADEAWAQAEITRLDELRAVGRERLLRARLDLGESALLVPELESLLANEPLREELWGLLVLALYRSQRQADALAALRRAREILAETLGVDPGPELRALERDVLSQSPILDAPSPRVTSPAAADRSRKASAPEEAGALVQAPGSAADLADREREVATLSRAVNAAAAGGGGVVLVEGPAGIGKTRLLLEAVKLANAAGLRVLSARSSQLEQTFGFGVVRQLFEPALAGPATRPEGLLTGPAASATGVFDDLAEGQRADGSFAVLHGLYWLTANLSAECPLLLTVDDVQWADTGSLRFLAYLVRRLEPLPVLVLLAHRTGETGQDDTLFGMLALEPSVEVLWPRPLSAEATALVVRDRMGDAADAFVAACHRTTAGNPLLLRQLVRALESEGIRPDVTHAGTVQAVGSRAIAGLVGLRLRRMPQHALVAARAVAVLGDGANLLTVAALAGLTEERAASALDALVRGEVLAREGGLSFVHPLVRDAVYDDLSPGDRTVLHEKAAHILERQGSDPEQIAVHLLRAPHRGSGAHVRILRDAARVALRRGASDSAVELLRRALDEPCPASERTELLVELGLAETRVDGPAAATHLSEALAVLDDPGRRAEVAVALARTHIFASPPGVATAFAREAAAALPDEVDDARQALLALQRTAGSMSGLPPSSYRDGPPPEVRGDGDGARMLAATLCYERTLEGEDRQGAIDLARFALAGDRLLDADNGLFWVFAATVLLVSDGNLSDAGSAATAGAGLAAFWERARRHAYATGSVFAAMSANLWRGFFEWRTGALESALQSLGEAADQNQMWGHSPVSATYIAAFTTGVYLDRGDVVAARRTIDAARGLPPVGEGTRLLHESATRLLLDEGRPRDALEQLAEAADPFGIHNPAWAPWRGLRVRALAQVGVLDEAIALAQEEVALLRRWGAPSSLGPALRRLGELTGPAGIEQLREAVDVLASGNAPVELARAQLALGRSPELSQSDAQKLLEQALEGARTCGTQGIEREAAAALQERGATIAAEG